MAVDEQKQLTRWPEARIDAVDGLRRVGLPMAKIALIAGVSRERVRQVLDAADEKRRRIDDVGVED